MHILVLGGTAFPSAEIARQALAAGHDVTCDPGQAREALGALAEPGELW